MQAVFDVGILFQLITQLIIQLDFSFIDSLDIYFRKANNVSAFIYNILILNNFISDLLICVKC